MPTPAQQAKYEELKQLLESSEFTVIGSDRTCQLLVTLPGPAYVQVFISVEGMILLIGETFAPWKGMGSQDAVDFISTL